MFRICNGSGCHLFPPVSASITVFRIPTKTCRGSLCYREVGPDGTLCRVPHSFIKEKARYVTLHNAILRNVVLRKAGICIPDMKGGTDDGRCQTEALRLVRSARWNRRPAPTFEPNMRLLRPGIESRLKDPQSLQLHRSKLCIAESANFWLFSQGPKFLPG